MTKNKNGDPKISVAEQRKTLHQNLNFAAAEAYKLLRTNLMFTLPYEQRCRIIGVTSSIRGEGKSTTSINLSYTLAETGQRVLLIDADMRLPSVAKKLEMKNTYGLSNILVSPDARVDIKVNKTPVLDNWHIITSGDIPPNPSELLGTNRMKQLLDVLVKRYDFIVIDLPPVNIVPDALVVSPLLDGMVLVVRENYTDRRSLNDCVRQLRLSDTKLLGFLLNGYREKDVAYGRYKKNYYQYGNNKE